jgi:amino-acid N-acetyltransferase
LLVANDLPVDDLEDPAIELFAAFDTDALIGVIGLQHCDGVGLLRSLAVDPSRRTKGVGRALCDHVVEVARGHGFDEVYLLTTGAADYFAMLGFARVERAAVPAAIRTTAQFATLCPASADVMRRSA